ncbi:MAG TPA: PE-PPE domain-containing protein [Mycobacterium sp.]|nr:PE-PPE domain-containing protein [Mycobacterium sp.]
MLPLTGVAAAAVAATLAVTPAVSTAPVLAAASVDYLYGTNIGWTPTDEQYRAFIGQVLQGTATPANPPTPAGNVAYNAGFWPVSHGYLTDLTWNASVAQGVQNLSARNPSGDVVFGMSQGAVVASQYKEQHPEGTGNTFLLVENPARPNGGVLSRFAGLYIPILNVTFTGATPDNGDPTIDIARQYDGWADFPTYPLNLLATVNALLGMAFVHGTTQTQLTAADIEAAKAAGDGSIYYQTHGNTTYYLIPTKRLPLLMPFTGIVPDPILDAVDAPLRALVELGYDRTDYSRPTGAKLLPPIAEVTQSAGAVASQPSAERISVVSAVRDPAVAAGRVVRERRMSATTESAVAAPAAAEAQTSASAGKGDVSRHASAARPGKAAGATRAGSSGRLRG